MTNRCGNITTSTPAKPAGDCGCGCGGSDPSKCPDKEKQATTSFPTKPDGTPDFVNMTQAQKLAYNQAERDRIYGTY